MREKLEWKVGFMALCILENLLAETIRICVDESGKYVGKQKHISNYLKLKAYLDESERS